MLDLVRFAAARTDFMSNPTASKADAGSVGNAPANPISVAGRISLTLSCAKNVVRLVRQLAGWNKEVALCPG